MNTFIQGEEATVYDAGIQADQSFVYDWMISDLSPKLVEESDSQIKKTGAQSDKLCYVKIEFADYITVNNPDATSKGLCFPSKQTFDKNIIPYIFDTLIKSDDVVPKEAVQLYIGTKKLNSKKNIGKYVKNNPGEYVTIRVELTDVICFNIERYLKVWVWLEKVHKNGMFSDLKVIIELNHFREEHKI